MNKPSENELVKFENEVRQWMAENAPDADFLLPESFMEVGTNQQFIFLQSWQNKVYEAGYLGMSWPKEYGGYGKHQAYQDVVTKVMSKEKVPFMVNTIGLNWAGPLILAIGTDEQKRRYIPGILSADDIWCQGFSEPDQGSDLGNSQCQAKKDGNEYVINGSKIWTSLGANAKYMILLARTSTSPKSKYEGLSFFLAPMENPAINPEPIKKLTGEFGFCQTFFDDARIPADSLMGNEGEGWKIAMLTLTFERSISGGQAGGTSSMPFNIRDVVDLATKSKRNGQPSLKDPLLRDEMVKFIIESRGSELMDARGTVKGLETDWPSAIAMSRKLRFSEFKKRASHFALKVQGSNGARYVAGDAVDQGMWQRSYLNSYSATIGGGTSEIQYNILGERVLGLPK